MRHFDIVSSEPIRAIMRVSLILWTFGHGLTVLIGGLKGRGYLVQFFVELPLWSCSLASAALLYITWRSLETRLAIGRWPLIGLACLAAGAVMGGLDLIYYDWLAKTFLPDWRTWAHNTAGRAANNFTLYSWSFALNVALFWALGVDEKAKVQKRIATEAKMAAQEAKIEALRLQLNPHFLLNTLNAVASLAAMNRNVEAERVTVKLAEFLHGTLMSDAKVPVALADELNTLETYLEIEAVRFGPRLRLEIDCPNLLLDRSVPSFILQPLVENAVKYAVAPSRSGALIRVVAREVGGALLISVSDTGTKGIGIPHGGTGLGLANVRARLGALYGENASLVTVGDAAGFVATLRLPSSVIRCDPQDRWDTAATF